MDFQVAYLMRIQQFQIIHYCAYLIQQMKFNQIKRLNFMIMTTISKLKKIMPFFPFESEAKLSFIPEESIEVVNY
jgi:hypothetical protein